MKKFRLFLLTLLVAVIAVGCEPERQYYPPTPNDPTEKPEDEGKDDEGKDDPEVPVDPTELPFISTNPAFVTEAMTEDVTVILNAKGTAADGFTGELYAHTGVLTSLSTSKSDWKYVKADWGVNIDDCKLQNKGNNIWYLTIKGGPRAYYGVPAGEAIEKLAFVFRSSDNSIEVKDNGNDIFIDIVEEGLSVAIVSPANGSVYQVGETCEVVVNQKAATSLTLYKNDEVVVESALSQVVYSYSPTAPEDVIFRAVATDGTNTVEDSVTVAVLGQTQNEARPAGVKDGVTIDGTSATFVLYAPGKKSVSLLGDFNNYAPTNKHLMKRDGDYFWVTVDGLQSGVEYGYQFLVDGTVKVGDPYATKILDPWNDKWINASVYPNLKAYPSEYTTDIVSVFDIDNVEYNWSVKDFDRPAENSLAVYELLLRDFTLDRSVDGALAKLDYLDELGVNAIELMPIQEFDGNDSWGYNPCFYFAPDKAYGTEEAYKRFIDECHKRGIAVILDVVFNHATGQFPWAKMWWDSSKNCTASDNPFFNVSAPHNWSVYHDFRHLYPKTRSYFKEVLQFWLTEYKVDGFRFDLTKGLVQNPGNYDANGYSSERIEILSDYARAIREVTPDAYIIFEHFCDQREETELYESVGGLCWNNNQMNGYMESVMGWYEGGTSTGSGSWSLMGDFQSNNWSNDIAFVERGGFLVAEDVVFADANKEGCVFKVRKNRNWNESYGVADGSKLRNIGAVISLDGSANVLVNAQVGVKYDFYFSPDNMTIYVMKDGAKPSVARPQYATRAGENKSNFADFKRGRMNNIETHDEERIAYKAITYGQSYVKDDWSVISKHLQAVYAFHFLTPYPKMLWQFGELGYDFSINSNENGVVGSGDDYRTHRKPVRWDYFDDANRKAVYTALSKVLKYRNDNEHIYGQDNLAVHTWKVGDSDMSGKQLVMDNVIMVANFTNQSSSTTVNVPATGQWRNLMTGETVNLGSSYTANLGAHDYIILVR